MKDTPSTSPKGELSKTDWKKIAIGAGVAIAGAALTAGADYILTIDFGVWTPFIASGTSILVNIVRKTLSGPGTY